MKKLIICLLLVFSMFSVPIKAPSAGYYYESIDERRARQDGRADLDAARKRQERRGDRLRCGYQRRRIGCPHCQESFRF